MSHNNPILDELSAAEPAFIRKCATPFSFAHGDRLADVGAPIEYVIFPQSGLISMVVALEGGEQIEAAMIGSTGALGASAGCGATHWVSTAVAQIAGQGLRIGAADIAALVQNRPALRNVLFAQEQYLLAQAQQMAACNARHHIPARLCSWLMRAHDAIGRDEFFVTQEFLAQILGVQRASISLIAGALQEDGLIRYRRGRVSIVDKEGLARKACECYQALSRHHHRLFPSEAVKTPDLCESGVGSAL